MILAYIELASALYLILLACMLNTYNFRSAILFQFFPSVLGIGVGFDAINRLGWLQLLMQ